MWVQGWVWGLEEVGVSCWVNWWWVEGWDKGWVQEFLLVHILFGRRSLEYPQNTRDNLCLGIQSIVRLDISDIPQAYCTSNNDSLDTLADRTMVCSTHTSFCRC